MAGREIFGLQTRNLLQLLVNYSVRIETCLWDGSRSRVYRRRFGSVAMNSIVWLGERGRDDDGQEREYRDGLHLRRIDVKALRVANVVIRMMIIRDCGSTAKSRMNRVRIGGGFRATESEFRLYSDANRLVQKSLHEG